MKQLKQSKIENGKPFYLSRIFWVNLIVLVAGVVQIKTGLVIPAELQIALLTLINIALRAITHKAIVWQGVTQE